MRRLLELSSGNTLKENTLCEMLSRVGLCAREYIDREINATLSGGEIKRIEIATVLARGTRFMLFDEPEAALSPSRQMALLCAIHNLVQQGSQVLMATHSPILMSYSGGVIYQLDGSGIRQVAYKDTEHYQLTLRFLFWIRMGCLSGFWKMGNRSRRV